MYRLPAPRPFAPPRRAVRDPATVWLFTLVGVTIGCQLALLFEVLAPFRVLFRGGPFVTSLVALFAVPQRVNTFPARTPAIAALGVLSLGLFHPDTNTALAAIAQIVLCAAILGPAFWVPRLRVSRQLFLRLVTLQWAFHTLSAAFGVLQVYFPGRFQPALSKAIQNQQWGGENLKITLADGEIMYRPMGLTDIPGGAAMAGLYAVVFGMGFLAAGRSWWVRWAGAGSMGLGLFCIYLSQVRSILVMAGVVAVVFTAGLIAAGRYASAVRLGVAVPSVAAAALVWALALGGQATANRLSSLVESDPGKLYYTNRGIFLEEMIGLVPEYPMGAGLGRWGMMSVYFGDPDLPGSRPQHVEIQWTGWLLDGGLPLIGAYCAAVGAAIWVAAWTAFRSTDPWLAGWAALILGYDTAVVAITFNYTPFIGQSGMEFWLLNATLFAVVRGTPGRFSGR